MVCTLCLGHRGGVRFSHPLPFNKENMKKLLIILLLLSITSFGGTVGLPTESFGINPLYGDHTVNIYDCASQTMIINEPYDHSGRYSFKVRAWGTWYRVTIIDDSTDIIVYKRHIGHFLINSNNTVEVANVLGAEPIPSKYSELPTTSVAEFNVMAVPPNIKGIMRPTVTNTDVAAFTFDTFTLMSSTNLMDDIWNVEVEWIVNSPLLLTTQIDTSLEFKFFKFKQERF